MFGHLPAPDITLLKRPKRPPLLIFIIACLFSHKIGLIMLMLEQLSIDHSIQISLLHVMRFTNVLYRPICPFLHGCYIHLWLWGTSAFHWADFIGFLKTSDNICLVPLVNNKIHENQWRRGKSCYINKIGWLTSTFYLLLLKKFCILCKYSSHFIPSEKNHCYSEIFQWG